MFGLVFTLSGCSGDTVSEADWQAATASTRRGEQRNELRSALDELVAAGVPGVVVRIIGPDRDETVAAGVRDLATNEPIDADTLFNLGAASNPYLAAVMLDYFDEGLLDLGDSVEDHLPDHFDYAWDIAIWDVLQHASGVPDYLAVGAGRGTVIESCLNEGRCRWEPGDALALVDGAEWEFQPGEGWGFSNTNYVLVGELMEEVDHMAWDEALHQRILAPSGLTRTFVPEDYGAMGAELARAYDDLDGDGTLDDVTAYLPADSGADGALAATPNDAAEFFHALFSGEVLSEAGQVALYATAPTGYGPEDFGLGVSFMHGYQAGQVGVTAQSMGHTVFVEHDIEAETTVVVMINQAGGLPPTQWAQLIGVATGLPNRTIHDRGTSGPGQLSSYSVLSEPSS